MKNTLLLLAFLCCNVIFAQEVVSNIDSLLIQLNKNPNDTSKVALLNTIGGHYNVTHLDSAKTFLIEGLSLAKKLKYDQGIWMSRNTLGNFYERKTQYDSAMYHYDKALDIIEKTNSTKGFAVVLNNIATIQIKKGAYQEAIDLMFEALKAEEELNNKNGIAQAYNNIGVCYYYMQNFDKTTFYLTKALEIQEELGNDSGLINGYMNVGAIQDYQKKYEEAIVSYKKCLAIAERIKDVKNQGSAIANIGNMYNRLEQTDKANQFLEQSIKIREDIKDYNGMASVYNSYAQNAVAQKKYVQANAYFEKSLELSKTHQLDFQRSEVFKGLSGLFIETKEYERASEYLQKFIALKDTILNQENSKAILELEAKYETGKKENEILAQRAEIAEKDLEVRKKNTWIVGGFALALVLGLLGYLMFNQQKIKNQQLTKESELKTALTRIETQNKLQEQRLRISRDLHDNIGSQLTFIISSIDNLAFGLKDSGSAVTSKLSSISAFTTTTIYELRDTIWAMNKNEITLEDLQSRIANFIEKASIASGETDFNFSISDKVNRDITFTSVQGMNIYRIIQEAVNNAIKYANGSQNMVLIDMASAVVMQVEVIDNGVGFDANQVTLSNGINNIKKRAKDLNGRAQIISSDTGTTVRVSFPVS